MGYSASIVYSYGEGYLGVWLAGNVVFMTSAHLKLGSVLVLVAVLVSGWMFHAGAKDRNSCFDDWSVAASAVKRNGLVSVEELSARAKKKLSGQIVKTTLCRTKQGFAYLVVVRTLEGRLETFWTDARNPFSDIRKSK